MYANAHLPISQQERTKLFFLPLPIILPDNIAYRIMH